LYYRQLVRDKEALMETLKRRERLKTLTANALVCCGEWLFQGYRGAKKRYFLTRKPRLFA